MSPLRTLDRPETPSYDHRPPERGQRRRQGAVVGIVAFIVLIAASLFAVAVLDDSDGPSTDTPAAVAETEDASTARLPRTPDGAERWLVFERRAQALQPASTPQTTQRSCVPPMSADVAERLCGTP